MQVLCLDIMATDISLHLTTSRCAFREGPYGAKIYFPEDVEHAVLNLYLIEVLQLPNAPSHNAFPATKKANDPPSPI